MADHLPDELDRLSIPFIFVRHSDPPPLDWMARHPEWVKIPAVMIPRNSPHHPAHGGPYPTFQAPPAAKMASVAEAEQWPLGRPVSAGLREAMSRLKPGGGPPRYPGGLGAPPGMFPGVGGDPVAAFLRANAVFEREAGVADVPARMRGSAGSAGDGVSPNSTERVQSVPMSPFTVPLPQVLVPGTPENGDFVRSLIGGARALGRAAEGGFHNKTDETPGSRRPTSVDELPGASSPWTEDQGKGFAV